MTGSWSDWHGQSPAVALIWNEGRIPSPNRTRPTRSVLAGIRRQACRLEGDDPRLVSFSAAAPQGARLLTPSAYRAWISPTCAGDQLLSTFPWRRPFLT